MFSFMRWGLFSAFCPKFEDILNQSVFSAISDIWLQSIYLLSWESFPLWGRAFWVPLSKKHVCTYSKCIFCIQVTGCPKNWKMPWNGLKTEVYDFHEYSCSTEKLFLYEVVPFWCHCPKYIDIFISKCIFPIQGVLKIP